jgi:hypothetical protein
VSANFSPSRIQVLGVVFVCIVVCVVVYTHQLVIPLFLGLLTWGKAWLNNLAMLFLKNGFVIQLRKLMMQASTHVLVKSHRPLRRKVASWKSLALETLKSWIGGYLRLPLLIRTAIAIAVLLVTAGSSFVLFALLIIPQPVLNWLKQRAVVTLNKLGITKASSALWKISVPEKLRQRWHMHLKWTIGRQQVSAAKHLHKKVMQHRSKLQGDDITNLDVLDCSKQTDSVKRN